MHRYKSASLQRASLRAVRDLHARASLFCSNRHGQGMTQFDMVVTQWAFVGPAFIFPEAFAIGPPTERELEGLKYVG